MSKLHLLVKRSHIDAAGNTTTQLFHTMRDSQLGWDPLGDVMKQTGPATIPPSSNSFELQNFTCAVDSSNGDLHVVALDRTGHLWHTIRTANAIGPWQPWDQLSKTLKVAGIEAFTVAYSPTGF